MFYSSTNCRLNGIALFGRLAKRVIDYVTPSNEYDFQSLQGSAYLESTGWGIDPLLPIIASLAYKQGAGHQENRKMLKTLLNER